MDILQKVLQKQNFCKVLQHFKVKMAKYFEFKKESEYNDKRSKQGFDSCDNEYETLSIIT